MYTGAVADIWAAIAIEGPVAQPNMGLVLSQNDAGLGMIAVIVKCTAVRQAR
jgi:hypothetical protein